MAYGILAGEEQTKFERKEKGELDEKRRGSCVHSMYGIVRTYIHNMHIPMLLEREREREREL